MNPIARTGPLARPGPGGETESPMASSNVSDTSDTPETPIDPESADGPDWSAIASPDIDNAMARQRLRRAEIPKRFLTKTLRGFHADTKVRKDILKAAHEYVNYFCLHRGQQVDGIMLEGKVGSGKTHVAVGILREIIDRGHSGLYCNVPEFLKEIRASYGANSGPDESELIDRTRDPDLLVLDDLGVEGRVLDPVRDRSRWLCERLYLIINGRYEADKPIVLTTNCSLEALRDQLDERTVSRIAEMTRRRFAHFPDQDYRLANLM